MEPYKPSQKAPVSGVLLTLILGVLAGIVAGLLASFIGQWLYLIILFPIAMSLVITVGLNFGIGRGKIRNPLLAAVIGIVSGMVAYAAMHMLDYQLFLREGRAIVLEEIGLSEAEIEAQAGPGALDLFLDDFLLQETGSSGLWGYIKLSAAEGVSIGRVGRSNDANLGSTFTWIYYLVELLLVSGFSAYNSWNRASEPFAEECDSWYGPKSYVGYAEPSFEAELKQNLAAGNFERINQALQQQPQKQGLVVFLQDVTQCDNERQALTVERLTVDRRGRSKTSILMRGLVTHEAAQTLRGTPSAT